MSDAPYRLFDYYRYEDRELFFGRDEEVARMVGDILSSRLLTLFAPSGSGKSSFLRAGVQPALEKRGFETVFTRVGDDPIASIIAAIETLESTPTRGASSLKEALADRVNPVVVVVDQFEELFLQFREESPKRREFPVKLAEALFDPSLRVYFVLSLRADYFVDLNEFREAIPAIFHNNANLELRPFDEDAARDAIAGPSERAESSFTWEPGLPERIARDLGDPAINPRGNGVLPITLQVVCHTMWSQLPDGRGVITSELYDDQGGAAAIINRRIFGTLEKTRTRDRRLLCQLLRELITKNGTKRIQPLRALHGALGAGRAMRTNTLLSCLKQDLLLRDETASGETWVELRHDYLAARMKPWLDNEERRLDARRRRNQAFATVAAAVVAAVSVWLWINYNTYTAEIGSAQRAADQDDPLVVQRAQPLRWAGISTFPLGWTFLVETGFTRQELQDGGIRHNTFSVPDAPADWAAIGEHLTPAARARLTLATRLDSYSSGKFAYPEGAPLPDPEALKSGDIPYYAAADDKVLTFALHTLKDGSVEAKQAAASTLGRFRTTLTADRADVVIAALVGSLEDKDAKVQSAAAAALGQLGAKLPVDRLDAIVQVLLKALESNVADVRGASAFALGLIGLHLSSDSVDRIVAALLTTFEDGSSQVRNSVAYGIWCMAPKVPSERAPTVVKALLAALKDSSSRFYNADHDIARALGRLGATLAPSEIATIIATLESMMATTDPEMVRLGTVALSEFVQWGRSEALLPLLGVPGSLSNFLREDVGTNLSDGVTARLLAALKDARDHVRTGAAIALVWFRANLSARDVDAVAGVLFAALEPGPIPGSWQVGEALFRLGATMPTVRPRLVAKLLAALKNRGEDTGLLALLGAMGANLPAGQTDAVVEALMAALGDTRVQVRQSAASALGRLGATLAPPRANAVVAALLGALENADEIVAPSAAFGLGQFGDNLPEGHADAVVGGLLASLQEKKIRNTAAVVVALGRLAAKLPPGRVNAVVGAVLAQLEDDKGPREPAVITLAQLRARMSATQIERALIGLSRVHTQRRSGKDGKDAGFDENDPTLKSIRELTRGTSEPATELLIRNLTSSTGDTRTLAIYQLARRTLSAEQLQRIRTLRDDADRRPWVRLAALETLIEIEREKAFQASGEVK